MRFPHLAHRSAAAHKLHSVTATINYEFDSGKGEPNSRLPALAYSPRKLSKRPAPSQVAAGGWRKIREDRERPCSVLREAVAKERASTARVLLGSMQTKEQGETR